MVRISLFTTRLLVIVSISHLYPYPVTRRPHGEKISIHHEAPRNSIHFSSAFLPPVKETSRRENLFLPRGFSL